VQSSGLLKCLLESVPSGFIDPANDGAEAVNAVADRVRAELLRNMGLSDPLHPTATKRKEHKGAARVFFHTFNALHQYAKPFWSALYHSSSGDQSGETDSTLATLWGCSQRK
jgi:hypothetical protein